MSWMSIPIRIFNGIFNNFWAKIISLILAVATWFYVFDLIHNTDPFLYKEKNIQDIFMRYKFITKEVPIKPILLGQSPKGYHIDFSKVKVAPPVIAIFGPEIILKDVEELETDKIDISEYTRSAKVTVGLHANTKLLPLKGNVVDVYLPVEKEEAK